MKPLNVHKPIKDGFILQQEQEEAKIRAKKVLSEIKSEESGNRITFSGYPSGKFTSITIRGDDAEEKFKQFCLDRDWDFGIFTKS